MECIPIFGDAFGIARAKNALDEIWDRLRVLERRAKAMADKAKKAEEAAEAAKKAEELAKKTEAAASAAEAAKKRERVLNIGGEGEVASNADRMVIDMQPGKIHGSTKAGTDNARRVQGGSSNPVVTGEGNKLPFPDNSMDRVVTNSVPVGESGKTIFGPNVSPSEIGRVLREGGEWVGDASPTGIRYAD